MYTKDIVMKPNNVYANIIEENSTDIKYKPSTIIANEFNEIGIEEYIGKSINGLNEQDKVMVAYLDQDVVKFKYDIVINLKDVQNIKKVFSKELNEQEKLLITNIIKGNIILKNNKIYVENFNEVDY